MNIKDHYQMMEAKIKDAIIAFEKENEFIIVEGIQVRRIDYPSAKNGQIIEHDIEVDTQLRVLKRF